MLFHGQIWCYSQIVQWKVGRLLELDGKFADSLFPISIPLYNLFIIQILYISLLQYMLMCFEGKLCCLLFRMLSNFQGLSKFQGLLPGISVKGSTVNLFVLY